VKILFADNVTRKLLPVLADGLATASDIKLAVAFVSYSGLSLIEPHVRECLALGGRAEFLVGFDLQTTEPKALRTLYEMSEAGFPIKCLCYSNPFKTSASIYHPKLYLMSAKDKVTIIVGSSNLTVGGLKGNLEINAIVEAVSSDEAVSDIYALYNRLKFEQPRVQLDADFINIYEALYAQRLRGSKKALADGKTKELTQQLIDKIAKMEQPKPTPNDLFGWQKIVFERLPTGTFRSSDLYTFEHEFQQYYPENRNIRAKIRQTLQQLRAMGLLGNPHRDRWERF
jgi:HKD family nuclease